MESSNNKGLVSSYAMVQFFLKQLFKCQTAHCGRRKLHFDFGASASPTAQSCG